jgi:hypothetical protein
MKLPTGPGLAAMLLFIFGLFGSFGVASADRVGLSC